MTQSVSKFARLGLFMAVGTALGSAALTAQAQAVITYQSYASAISLNVPTAKAAATCAPLAATAPTAPLTIKRTFWESFDTLDLKSTRWTPHYNGGYNATTKTWLGYDWIVKRTQTSAHEQQLYVDPDYKGLTTAPLGLNPFVVETGILHIVANRVPETIRAKLSGYEFTSGVLTTRKSFSQRYGYFEARIKVPSTQALLPAFWLMPIVNTWPPELDIMEAPTHQKDIIQNTVHWVGANGAATASACKINYPNYSKDFHQYGALWTAEKIVYYIDRVPVSQIATPPGLNVPMFMQLNLAVGGDWIGAANANTPIPAEMLVDNVVAYSVEGPNSCGTQADGTLQCPAK
jgi:beta-glucanase (GH16 family)